MNPNKTLHAFFFKTATGSEPVRGVIKNLPTEEKKRIGEAIKAVEFGWPIGLPVCRNMGSGLWEVRADLPNRIFRVLFGIDGDLMVLLHGFVKKTRKTPQKDLDVAKGRWKEYRRRKKAKRPEKGEKVGEER